MILKEQSVSFQEAESLGEDPDPLPLEDLSLSSNFISLNPYHSLTTFSLPLSHKLSIPISSRSLEFMQCHYPHASLQDWNNWHWQIQNSIASIEDLARVVCLSEEEKEGLFLQKNTLPLRITPYYASLIDKENLKDPLRKCMVPNVQELTTTLGECADPLGEDGHSPVQGLVHRYPDRVLFLATEFCSAYCRYCTRSRLVGNHCKSHLKKQWEGAIFYIENHPEIRDVVISGGDPLTLSDQSLDWLLTRLRNIPHLQIIRIGTKVPAVLPQRITPKLVKILKKFHPLYMSLHFTHPNELTEESKKACSLLADAGIPLGSQTVLLKEINDNVPTMTALMHQLLMARVKPYYIYQCDPIIGSSHFRTSVKKGLEIIQGLRGHTSGYAIPHYVIDAPKGGGKIPLLPEYYLGKEGNEVLLKNYEGKIFSYPDSVVD